VNSESYLTLGPAVPYLIRGTNTFVTGDFDGDGRCEVASYCPANNSLNILSYFEYSDVLTQWSGTAPQMINAWACLGTLPAGPGVAQAWSLQSNDICLSAYLSGKGAFLVIFNPTSLNFGIAQWTGTSMQLVWFSTGSSAPYCGLNAADRFYVADVDGDGNDELIQFTPDDLYLFVLKFQPGPGAGQAGTLSYISSSHDTVGPWTMSSTDILVPAHLEAGTSDQLLVISSTSENYCVLSYANGSFSGVALQGPYFVVLTAALQAGDFDGDGLDEIVDVSVTAQLLKWNGAQFAGLQWDPSEMKAYPHPIQQAVPMKRSGSGDVVMGVIPTYPPTPLVLVSGLVNSIFTVLWMQNGSIPGNVGLNTSDQFYAADVDGDGNDELLMFSAADGWLFTIKWTGTQLQDFTSVQNTAPAWGIDLLAQAPKSPFGFVSFAGNQLIIYQKISQALYAEIAKEVQNEDCSPNDIRSCYEYLEPGDFVDLQVSLNAIPAPDPDTQFVVGTLTGELIYSYMCSSIDADCDNDIRSEYTNRSYTDYESFGILAAEVRNLSQPQTQCWTAAAWSDMQEQLVAELFGMGSVVNWGAAMTYMNDLMQDTQTEALNIALMNVNGTTTPPADNSKVASVVMSILSALLCGAAGLPIFSEVPAGPVVLAFAGALFPGVFTAFQSDPSQPPAQVSYSQFAAQIEEQFAAATALLTAQVQTFSSDSVLLPLVGGLLNGSPTNQLWKVNDADILAYVTANLTPTVLQYYVTFIPMRFKFLYWMGSNNNVPYYCKLVAGWNNDTLEKVPLINTQSTKPPYPYFSEPCGSGNYNLYLLCNGSLGANDRYPSLSYPIPDLITDLFTTRGVSQEDFFLGNGVWAGIARQQVIPDC
jgi:hypothetical protein